MASITISNINITGCVFSINVSPQILGNCRLRYRIRSGFYDENTAPNEQVDFEYDGRTYDPNLLYNSLPLTLNHWLIPNRGYIALGYYEYPRFSGTWTLAGTYIFTTLNITPPATASYTPTYLPAIRDQFVYDRFGNYTGEANCCVASALSTMLDIMEYRERGTSSNLYSTSYIYGNRSLQSDLTDESDGMITQRTIEQLQNDGTPEWQNIPDNANKSYPDNRFLYYNDGVEQGAKPMFDNQGDYVRNSAKVQKLGSYTDVNFYDCQAVANAIQNHGFYLINFSIPNNFYDSSNFGPNYLVPTADSYSGNNHTMLLIGWNTINGVKYWLAQQSWGTNWALGGYCYIPMDWNASIASPYSDMSLFWVYMGQQVTNFVASIPTSPNAPVAGSPARLDLGANAGLNIAWTSVLYGNTYKLEYKRDVDSTYTAINNIRGDKYQLTGLEWGRTYNFKVTAINYKGSNVSTVSNLTTMPSKPTNITALPGTGATVDVSFTKGISASGYTIGTDIDFTKTNGVWGTVEYPNQSLESHNIDVTTATITYFRFRTQITVSGTTIYSEWTTTIIVSFGNNLKVYLNNQWVSKPLKVYLNGQWVSKPLKRWDGSNWV